MGKISALRKIIIAGVFASAIFVSVPAFAASTLYEQIDEQLLAKGIN